MVGAAILAVAAMIAGGDEPASEPPSYEGLKRRYEAAEAAWTHEFERPEMTDPKGNGAILRYREWPAWEFAPKFLAIAERDPKGPGAFESLLWLSELNRQVGTSDRAVLATHARALRLLQEHYLDNPRLKTHPEVFRGALSPAGEAFLRRAMQAKDREVRGLATLRLGMLLGIRARVRRAPWYVKADRTAFESFLASRLDPEFVRYIAATDPDVTEAEAVRLLSRVQEEFGDVVHRNSKLSEMATKELAEIVRAKGDRK